MSFVGTSSTQVFTQMRCELRCTNLESIHYCFWHWTRFHYDDVIMSTLASQIISLTIVYSTIYSGADQSKHQSSASLAFVCGIHRGPVNSTHKWPVTRKMFPFDDVIMGFFQLKDWYICQWSGISWITKLFVANWSRRHFQHFIISFWCRHHLYPAGVR